MKAIELINLAEKINMGISRKTAGVYEYHQTVAGVFVTNEFQGTYQSFVRFIKNRVAAAK